MADLTPRTRSESFLNGEDLEPITRREHFYAGRESELPAGHQEPKTREEWFIQKYREAGDVTVESLSITENGTYTAPSGKAYSPVSVNVPLPSNAYLLKSIEHESIAAFTDGTDNFIKSLEVAIEPMQSGSGEPSPTNIRPISGWDEVNVTRCGVNVWDEVTEFGYYDVRNGVFVSNANQLCAKNFIPVKPNMTLYGYKGSYTGYGELLFYDKSKNYISYLSVTQWINKEFTVPDNCFYVTFNLGSTYGTTYNNDISINYPSTDTEYHAYNGQTYTIDLDGTRYGGKLDVINGVLTVDRAYVDMGTLNYTYEDTSTPKVFRATLSPTPKVSGYTICSVYKGTSKGVGALEDGELCISGTSAYPFLRIRDDAYTDATAFKTSVNGQQLVYELATPQTIQLPPTIIKSLQGENNFFADSGEIEILQYWGEVS